MKSDEEKEVLTGDEDNDNDHYLEPHTDGVVVTSGRHARIEKRRDQGGGAGTRVHRIQQKRDPENCYRWKSLKYEQKLEWCLQLADIRRQRKGDYGKKCNKDGKFVQQTRDESAEGLVKTITECVRDETLLVEYERDRDRWGDPFGREYAKQATAAQRLPREVRALLYANDWDVDMVDAQRRIVYDWLMSQGKLSEFPEFKKSVKNRDHYRDEFATLHDCSLGEAKTIMTIPLFSASSYSAKAAYGSWCEDVGTVQSDESRGWYEKYHTECHKIRKLMLDINPVFREHAKKADLFRQHSGEEGTQQKNNEGSAMALLLQTWEWQLLHGTFEALKDAGFDINASIHDGCHTTGERPDAKSITETVRSRFAFIDGDLRRFCEPSASLHMFELKVKPFEKIPLLPPPQRWSGFERARMGEWNELSFDPLRGTHSKFSYPYRFEYTHMRIGKVHHDDPGVTEAGEETDSEPSSEHHDDPGVTEAGEETDSEPSSEHHDDPGVTEAGEETDPEPSSEVYMVVELSNRFAELCSPTIMVAFPASLPTPIPAYTLYVKLRDKVGWRSCGVDLSSRLLLGLDSRKELNHSEIVALTRLIDVFKQTGDPMDAFEIFDGNANLRKLVPDGVGLLTEAKIKDPVYFNATDRHPEFVVSGDTSSNVSVGLPGTGKTHQAKEQIKRLPEDTCVLWIAPSRSLHLQLDSDLAELNFTGYKKKSGAPLTSSELRNAKRLHITPESLPKLMDDDATELQRMIAGGKYKLIVVDEWTTVLGAMLISPTCRHHRKQRLDLVFQLIRNTPHVIILDADLSDYDLECIQSHRSESAKVYLCREAKSTWTNFELPGLNELLRQAAHDIDMDKTIFISADTKRKGCHVIASYLRSTLAEKDADRIIVVDRESKEKNLRNLERRMEKAAEEGRPVLAIIVSPTVVTGVDFSKPLIDTVYTYLSGSTLSPYGAYQQMCRIRKEGMRGEHTRYVVIGQRSNKSTDTRTLALYRGKIMHQIVSGKAWSRGAREPPIIPALNARELDERMCLGKLDTKLFPYFEEKVREDFKSKIGNNGYFRSIFRALCIRRGDSWNTCTAKTQKSALRMSVHPAAQKEFNTRIVTSTEDKDKHAHILKERIARAMSMNPENLTNGLVDTLTTIDDLTLRWARLRGALIGKPSKLIWDVDSRRVNMSYKVISRLTTILGKLLGCDLNIGKQKIKIVSKAIIPTRNEHDIKELSHIIVEARSLGEKGRCRREKKDPDNTESKTFMDLFKRLVDIVYPFVPHSDGKKKKIGILQMTSKRIRSGLDKNKYTYTYFWNKEFIRVAAENAIAAGRIKLSDVLPHFLSGDPGTILERANSLDLKTNQRKRRVVSPSSDQDTKRQKKAGAILVAAQAQGGALPRTSVYPHETSGEHDLDVGANKKKREVSPVAPDTCAKRQKTAAPSFSVSDVHNTRSECGL
jgi:hypothetical protein